MTTKQITKPIEGKMYSYDSRFSSKSEARQKALSLNRDRHCYYTKITVKGEIFYDVRTENPTS